MPLALLKRIEVRNLLLQRAPDDLFTAEESAIYCGVAPRTFRNWTVARALAADARAGRAPLFKRSTLDTLLARRAGGRS